MEKIEQLERKEIISNTFIRHLHTGLLTISTSLITAGIIGGFVFYINMNKYMAANTIQQSAIIEEVKALRVDMNNQKIDHNLLSNRVTIIEEKIKK